MLKFNIIVAMCDNYGIGNKGVLPWNLKSELKYFSNTTKRVNNTSKRNVVIMGRKTYFSIPANRRPLVGRINLVLSTTLSAADLPSDVLLQPNLNAAMKYLEIDDQLRDSIETVWIAGGSGVYREAIASERCHRLYVTKIQGNFECDTYFPMHTRKFREILDTDVVPQGVQIENGICYEYKIFEKQ